MATYSLNTTIKISAAISAVGSNPSYAVPASSYGIVNCYSASAGFGVTIGGNTVAVSAAGGTTFTIYVGPSQTVALNGAGAGSTITGVEFLNSP